MKTFLRIALFSVFLVCLGSAALEAAGKSKKIKPLKAPDFPKKAEWINAPQPLTNKAFQKKLTLVYFWDYSSSNILREIAHLKEWDERYRPYGLQMIWIHSPEFNFAKDRRNVELAVARLKIPFPVLMDNDFKMWDGFKVKSWPSKILVSGDRTILHSQIGEGRYTEFEGIIRKELQSMDLSKVLPARVFESDPEKFSFEECGDMTAETYTGYKRAGWWAGRIANKQHASPNQTVTFRDRGERVQRGFFAEGVWANLEDHFQHARNTEFLEDYLGFNYIGFEIYAVLANHGAKQNVRVYVTRDGLPVEPGFRGVDVKEDETGKTYVLLEEPRLYYLITNENEEVHEVKLWVMDEGVGIYSFAFANRCLSDFDHT